jgi:hypothetical protein
MGTAVLRRVKDACGALVAVLVVAEVAIVVVLDMLRVSGKPRAAATHESNGLPALSAVERRLWR